MHDEAPRYRSTQVSSTPAPDQPGTASTADGEAVPSQSNGQLSDGDREMLEAVKNIFDAEEVEP
jgi:hypothetical protein